MTCSCKLTLACLGTEKELILPHSALKSKWISHANQKENLLSMTGLQCWATHTDITHCPTLQHTQREDCSAQMYGRTENTALSFLLLKGNAGKTSSFHKVHHSWLALVVYLCCHSNYSIVSKKAKQTKKINPNKTERCDPGTPEICSYTHYVTWPLQIQRQEIKHCQHWASWRLLHIDKWVKSKKVDGNLQTDLPCI